MAYDYELVLCAKDKGVLKITLNQPETLNALTPELEKNLHEALYEGDADPGVFCMVIHGAGRGFCAGYRMGSTPKEEAVRWILLFTAVLANILQPIKYTIIKLSRTASWISGD